MTDPHALDDVAEPVVGPSGRLVGSVTVAAATSALGGLFVVMTAMMSVPHVLIALRGVRSCSLGLAVVQ